MSNSVKMDENLIKLAFHCIDFWKEYSHQFDMLICKPKFIIEAEFIIKQMNELELDKKYLDDCIEKAKNTWTNISDVDVWIRKLREGENNEK